MKTDEKCPTCGSLLVLGKDSTFVCSKKTAILKKMCNRAELGTGRIDHPIGIRKLKKAAWLRTGLCIALFGLMLALLATENETLRWWVLGFNRRAVGAQKQLAFVAKNEMLQVSFLLERIHGHEQPLIARLIRIRQSRFGAVLGQAQIKTHANAAIACLLIGGLAQNSQFPDRDKSEFHLGFNGIDNAVKSELGKQVFGPAGQMKTVPLQSLTVTGRRLRANGVNDRLPCFPSSTRFGDDEGDDLLEQFRFADQPPQMPDRAALFLELADK